jgi:predicted nucleotidyltransferase
MSNIYKTNFHKVKEVYKGIFDALERALIKFEIDYYLIGAQSRDVWTNHLDLDKRTTRDIDYCVYVKDPATWNMLTEYLIKEEGFKRDEKEPYRFYFGEIVDLIPFGGIEENGEAILTNPTTELSVYGCKEVTEEAVLIEGTFKVVTLAGLCVMKLIAYNEKPGSRAKDIDDFFFLVKNYHEIAGEELFDGNYDDLLEGDFEMQIASARMLGRHMTAILKKNKTLKEKIVDILNSQLSGFGENDINQMYEVRENNDESVLKFKLVLETIKGIKDTE